jgi:hypothetical protein
VEEVCSLILRDEAGHVAFHRDRLASQLEAGTSLLWTIQFWGCGLAAAMMLWVNHRPCLEAMGATQREFYKEARCQIARFIRKLSSSRVSWKAAKGSQRPLQNVPQAGQARRRRLSSHPVNK